MPTLSGVRTAVRDALVNANITVNSDSVPVWASYNDEDVTQQGNSFIAINPVEDDAARNRFGSDYEEHEYAVQIYVFSPNSFALTSVTEDVVDNLPDPADGASLKEYDTDYAFTPAQDVEMESYTVSVFYQRK